MARTADIALEWVASIRAEITELRARIDALEAEAQGGGADAGAPQLPVGQVLDLDGGGGSHMGNKAGSVKFDGEATFGSASDANVEVLTAKTNAEGEAEKGTITIGVYWT